MPEKDVVTIEDIQARQEEINRQLQALSAEFARMAAESIANQTKFQLFEQQSQRHEEEIRQLKESTKIIQIQFEQMMGKLDTFEMKIFSWLQQSQQDIAKERQQMQENITNERLRLQKDSARERTNNQKDWIKFVTYVIGATLALAVMNYFTRGG